MKVLMDAIEDLRAKLVDQINAMDLSDEDKREAIASLFIERMDTQAAYEVWANFGGEIRKTEIHHEIASRGKPACEWWHSDDVHPAFERFRALRDLSAMIGLNFAIDPEYDRMVTDTMREKYQDKYPGGDFRLTPGDQNLRYKATLKYLAERLRA